MSAKHAVHVPPALRRLLVAVLLGLAPSMGACDDSSVEEANSEEDVVLDHGVDSDADSASNDTTTDQDEPDSLDVGLDTSTDSGTSGEVADSGSDATEPGDCSGLVLTDVPANGLSGDPVEPNTERTYRVYATYNLTGCQSRAMWFLEMDEANRKLGIGLRVWDRYGEICPPSISADVRRIDVRFPAAGDWIVHGCGSGIERG